MSSEQPIKVGIIGLSTRGWASTAHAAALLHPSLQSTYTLTAVQTSSETSAKASKELYSSKVPAGTDIKAYHGDDSTALANDPNVDVVGISVKAPGHKAAFEAAVAAGKHIFVEYPPGRNLEESLALRRAANRNGKIQVTVGLQGVQSSVLRKVKKVIDSGKLGKIISTTFIGTIPREARYWQPETAIPQIYAIDPTNGASFLNIVGGHSLAGFHYLLGNFASVSATASVQYPTTDVYTSQVGGEYVKTVKSESFDHYTISGALRSGAHASIVWRGGSKIAPGRTQLVWLIDGDEGSIKFSSDGIVPPGSLMNIADPASVTVNGQALDDYLQAEGIECSDDTLVLEEGEKGTTVEFVRREWVEFAKALRGGKGEFATLEDAIEVQKVVEAVEQSARLGGSSVKIV